MTTFTAVRELGAHSLSEVQRRSLSIPVPSLAMLLGIAVLVSAFLLVYVKDLNRRLFIQYQGLQAQAAQEYIDSGKLLLEQSTWSTQARIQQIAEQRLSMMVPATSQVVMIQDPQPALAANGVVD